MAEINFDRALPEITSWLKAHGVQPGDVPRDARPRCNEDGSVWLPLFERPRRLVDDEVAMTEVTIRPHVEPSAAVMAWLAGDLRPAEEISSALAGGTPEPTDG